MASIFDIYVDGLRKLLAQKRFLVLVGAATGMLATLTFLSEMFAYSIAEILAIDVRRTSLLLLLVSFVSFALLYLQSGGAPTAYLPTDPGDRSDEQRDVLARLTTLEKSASDLQGVLDLSRNETTLSTEDKERLLKAVVDRTTEAAINSSFDERVKALTEDLKRNTNLEYLASSSRQLVTRLRREITDLRLRSNINLIIGMAITLGGLYLLWSTISIVDSSQLLKTLAAEGNESNSRFLKSLVLPVLPRILLVIFIEVLAYFFLRLYRNGLSEIKYFQNELTNVESKLLAVEFSYAMQNATSLKSSLDALSKTERNFILTKGQTTVELERAKSESDLTRNIIKTIPDIFKSVQTK